MQFVVAVLFFAASARSYTQKPTIPEILAHWRLLIAPYKSECICETHVNPELLDNAFNYGDFVGDACLKCSFKCLAIKLGITNASGRFDPARIHEVFPYVSQDFAFKCTNIVEPDVCEKTYKSLLCVFKGLTGQLYPKSNDGLHDTL